MRIPSISQARSHLVLCFNPHGNVVCRRTSERRFEKFDLNSSCADLLDLLVRSPRFRRRDPKDPLSATSNMRSTTVRDAIMVCLDGCAAPATSTPRPQINCSFTVLSHPLSAGEILFGTPAQTFEVMFETGSSFTRSRASASTCRRRASTTRRAAS